MSDRRPVPDASTNMLPRPKRPKQLPRGSNLAPDGREFAWGPVDRTHRVTPFIAVVEYREDRSKFLREEAWALHGKISFHPYLRKSVDTADVGTTADEWRDTSTSYDSLEDAIIGAIARRRLGPNAGMYAARFINQMLDTEEV